jgi:hypothetical protein
MVPVEQRSRREEVADCAVAVPLRKLALAF